MEKESRFFKAKEIFFTFPFVLHLLNEHWIMYLIKSNRTVLKEKGSQWEYGIYVHRLYIST